MRHVFFDTSALVKRYYREQGTDIEDRFVEDESNRVVITTLSVVETASAFRRKYDEGELTANAVDRRLAAFFGEALADFAMLPIEDVQLDGALDLDLDDDLRTLDSIQLTAALTLDGRVDDLLFACADADLVSVAEGHDVETVAPGLST